MPEDPSTESHRSAADVAARRRRAEKAQGGQDARDAAVIAAARLAAIVESSEDAIIGKDLRGYVTSWNQGAQRLFGYSAEEMIGQSITRLIPPERQAEETEILRRIAKGERVHHFETLRVRKDGRSVELSVTVSPIKDASGTIIGASKTARDIGERKRFEASMREGAAERERAFSALRHSEARMRLAAEATGVGIWEWDVFTNTIRWDAELFRIYGVEPTPDGRVPYSDWAAAVLPEDLPENEAILRETLGRGGRSVRQFRIRRRSDGRCRYIESVETTQVNAQGQTQWMVGTNLDITERKLGEAALVESEARFRDVADNISQLAWIADATGRVSWFNRRWFDYTGKSLAEMEGNGWRTVHHPDHLQRALQQFHGCIASGKPWEDTFPLRSRSGEYRWFLSRAQPIRDAEGRVVRWFGTNTDITEIRATESAVREAKAEADAANQRKDRFFAILSHELRSPLTPVLMAVSALERDPGMSSAAREQLGMIRRNLDLEIKLIDDLLDLNRITNGKLALQVEAVDLNELVRQACKMYRLAVDERGLTLETAFDESVGRVSADPARLLQVLGNVLGNAIKFTPQGGEIHVATAALAAGRCAIRVRDTGIGIPPEVLPRIFVAFEQGAASTHRQFGGLGLGLAICKVLVELHDGAMRAESDGPGRGATFIVELPARAPAPATKPTGATGDDAPRAGLRLLVVEDHADTAQALARLLRSAGHTVTIAGDIAGAVEAAEREPFDILVSDLGLPDGSGNDLMRRVREIRAMRGIAMSGFGMEEDLRSSREAGFAVHLVKPIAVPALEDAIRRVMGQHD